MIFIRYEMIAPTFFFIGCLVMFGIMEIRKWLEMIINAGRDSDSGDEKSEDMPESVKHMYN